MDVAAVAERIMVDGREFHAALIDNLPYLIPSDIFRMLFREAPKALDAAQANKAHLHKEAKAPTFPEPSEAAVPVARASGEDVIAVLRNGPLTTAKIGDRLYPGQKDSKLRYQNAWARMKKLHEAKQVVRKPHNGLDMWHVAEA